MKRLSIIVLPRIAIVVLAALFLGGWAQASAATVAQFTGGSSACGVWSMVASPNVGTSTNYLNGVTALSARNVWAVGTEGNGSGGLTLAEHWTGTQWKVVTSPNVNGSRSDSLSSVAAVSANNVWAVGNGVGTNGIQTLIEHWNGSSWSVVSSSGPGLATNTLNGVATISANNIWAVGDDSSSTGPSAPFVPLVEHWNGSSWSVVTSPVQGTSGFLRGVAAVSARNLWAVGDYRSAIDPNGPYFTLIEHWNGTSWSVVKSPNPGPVSSVLAAAARVPTTKSLWSVGYLQDNASQTLTEFYC